MLCNNRCVISTNFTLPRDILSAALIFIYHVMYFQVSALYSISKKYIHTEKLQQPPLQISIGLEEVLKMYDQEKYFF